MTGTRHINPIWVSLFLLVLHGGQFFCPSAATAAEPAASQSTPSDTRTTSDAVPAQSAPSVIQYFQALSAALDIDLMWAVCSDRDVLGFKIYRKELYDAYFVLVNEDGLIPAWQWDYRDCDLDDGTTYQYTLGVVHADGSEVFSGPAEATTSSRYTPSSGPGDSSE